MNGNYFERNYYSNYSASDFDNDDFYDLPYNISGTYPVQDSFPLVNFHNLTSLDITTELSGGIYENSIHIDWTEVVDNYNHFTGKGFPSRGH